MIPKKVLIINRSFWPTYSVLGDGLLTIAEKLSERGHVVNVAFLGNRDFWHFLEIKKRGLNIRFFRVISLTTSGSSIIKRISEIVFFTIAILCILFWVRPNKVYISTDPPIIIPFIVRNYCIFSKAEYIYHVQDIHPEALNTLKPLNKIAFDFFRFLDNRTIKNAKKVITLNQEMASKILGRLDYNKVIEIVENPAAFSYKSKTVARQKNGICYCGNAGRFQRIPLVLNAIKTYYEMGGLLEITFAGGGVYETEIQDLSNKFISFNYLGKVGAKDAARMVNENSWALLPIEDEITNYSFPSKTSTYACSNSNILAICGQMTSVANWINKYKLGIVIEPKKNELVDTFFKIQNKELVMKGNDNTRNSFRKRLNIETFSNSLCTIILDE